MCDADLADSQFLLLIEKDFLEIYEDFEKI